MASQHRLGCSTIPRPATRTESGQGCGPRRLRRASSPQAALPSAAVPATLCQLGAPRDATVQPPPPTDGPPAEAWGLRVGGCCAGGRQVVHLTVKASGHAVVLGDRDLGAPL